MASTKRPQTSRADEHHTDPTPPRSRGFLRKRQAAARVNVSQKTIDRWSDAGLFPPKVQLGPNSVGFREADVDEWEQNRPRAAATAPNR